MDAMNLVYDWLFTRRTRIKKRSCRRFLDGDGYFCVPSAKYTNKGAFKRICPYVDAMVLDPIAAKECGCTLPDSAGERSVAVSEDLPAPQTPTLGLETPGETSSRPEPLVPKVASPFAVSEEGTGKELSAVAAQPGPEAKEWSGVSGAGDPLGDPRFHFHGLRCVKAPGDWITVTGVIENVSEDQVRFISLEIRYLNGEGAEVLKNICVVTNLAPKQRKAVRLSTKVAGFDRFEIGLRNVIGQTGFRESGRPDRRNPSQ